MSVSDIRKKMAQIPLDPLKCHVCGISTPFDVLSALGARCQACYRRYCDEPIEGRIPEKMGSGPEMIGAHGWAYRLRARKAAGIRLSPAQAHCLAEFDRRNPPAPR